MKVYIKKKQFKQSIDIDVRVYLEKKRKNAQKQSTRGRGKERKQKKKQKKIFTRIQMKGIWQSKSSYMDKHG